ncbi:F-box incomplete domain containing protein [Pandoravirus quercus]|uniref:F-box incomplete domain containing protein n=1 Tax=Pandoravirus quercus TaxID=2107709 RepID=A0A2U7U7R2_9VIRU|nr:F-box incomplete domain containing protein [Pandoravirus quercus]AVK74462.1 F-box incomplete domain containing protein [Pandoravirus quercus]
MASTVGLGNLPDEIIVHILGYLTRLRDLAACAAASSILAVEPLASAAARLASVTLGNLLEAGAPLDVVRAVYAHRGPASIPPDWIVAVVRVGSIDIVEWACAVPEWTLVLRAAAHRDDAGPAPRPYKRTKKGDPVDDALCLSIECGRFEMLAWLLSHCNTGPSSLYCRLDASFVRSLLIKVVRAPGAPLDVIIRLHDYSLLPNDDGTVCTTQVERAALDADRADVLEWVRTRGCQCLSPDNLSHATHSFVCAVRAGSAAAARWVYANTAPQTTPPAALHDRYDMAEITKAAVRAASNGHVRVLAMLCRLGFDPLPLDALMAAARGGHLHVLQWATMADACDDVDDDNGKDGDAHMDLADAGPSPSQPPAVVVQGWPSLLIGYAAALGGHEHIVRWLAHRPDARRNLSVGAARAALKRGHVAVVLALDKVGIAPFDQWDPLCTAVRSNSVATVAAIAEHVAVCTPCILTSALFCRNEGVIQFLCERYGIDHLQEAIDAAAGRFLAKAPLLWVRDNVSSVCVASACAYLYAARSCDRAAMDRDRLCRCTQCL